MITLPPPAYFPPTMAPLSSTIVAIDEPLVAAALVAALVCVGALTAVGLRRRLRRSLQLVARRTGAVRSTAPPVYEAPRARAASGGRR